MAAMHVPRHPHHLLIDVLSIEVSVVGLGHAPPVLLGHLDELCEK